MTMPETLKPDELVERYRHGRFKDWLAAMEWCDKAADRIEALQSDLERVTSERDVAREMLEERRAMINRLRPMLVAAEARALTAEAALVKARTALEPFAVIADAVLAEAPHDATKAKLWNGVDNSPLYISLDACRAARLALSAGEEENGR